MREMTKYVINVQIICFDGIIEKDINEIILYPYFNRCLNTSIGSNNFEFKKTDSNVVTEYYFRVPHIKVVCTIEILNILLDKDPYWINYENTNDKLVDILVYNDMYMMNKKIGYNIRYIGTEGDTEPCYDKIQLVNIVKSKMPYCDPFDILKRGGFCPDGIIWSLLHGSDLRKLNPEILPDLFQYLEETLLRSYQHCIRHLIDNCIDMYHSCPEIIFQQFNSAVVKAGHMILPDIIKGLDRIKKI